jgi:hypothetical protein
MKNKILDADIPRKTKNCHALCKAQYSRRKGLVEDFLNDCLG